MDEGDPGPCLHIVEQAASSLMPYLLEAMTKQVRHLAASAIIQKSVNSF